MQCGFLQCQVLHSNTGNMSVLLTMTAVIFVKVLHLVKDDGQYNQSSEEFKKHDLYVQGWKTMTGLYCFYFLELCRTISNSNL